MRLVGLLVLEFCVSGKVACLVEVVCFVLVDCFEVRVVLDW